MVLFDTPRTSGVGHNTIKRCFYNRSWVRGWDPVKPLSPAPPTFPPPPSILILTVPRRYFCCGSLLLLVLAVSSYTFVHLLREWHILVKFRWLNDHLSREELFIGFTAHVIRKLLSVYVFSYFPFGFEGRILDLIVSVPDHCLCFYFLSNLPHRPLCCPEHIQMSLVTRKPVFGIFDQVWLKPVCSATEIS